jgi:hypothetical protein
MKKYDFFMNISKEAGSLAGSKVLIMLVMEKK